MDEAGAIARLTARAIYKQVETQQAHFMETPDGKLLICLRSLLEAARMQKSPPDQRHSDKLEIEQEEDRRHENQKIF